jgi:hypothetical protein
VVAGVDDAAEQVYPGALFRGVGSGASAGAGGGPVVRVFGWPLVVPLPLRLL